MPSGGVREAGAGLPLILPYWTWSTPSFALQGGARGTGAAAAATLLDEVYAFLRAAEVEAWLKGHAAAAGPAGNLKNVLLLRCVGCDVADSVRPSQKKTGMKRSSPTPTDLRPASWSGGSGAPTSSAERRR